MTLWNSRGACSGLTSSPSSSTQSSGCYSRGKGEKRKRGKNVRLLSEEPYSRSRWMSLSRTWSGLFRLGSLSSASSFQMFSLSFLTSTRFDFFA